ncbi:MAG: hypothetical protein J6C20_03490 [Paludibacteraceae bacterium]|nr:hypothetical protein [Paludibacteraceae bacterium]
MIQIEFENKMREQNFILKKVKELYGRRMSAEKQKLTNSLSEIEIAHRLRVIELLKDEEMASRKREVLLQENLLERARKMQKTTEAYNEVITGLKEKLEQEEENVQSKISSIAKEYESSRKEELKEKGVMEQISEMRKEIDRIKLAIRFKM